MIDLRRKTTKQGAASINTRDNRPDNAAIIGVGIQMPNVSGIDELWEYVKAGIDFVRPFPEKRRREVERYYEAAGRQSDNKKSFYSGAFIDRTDCYDYTYFQNPRFDAQLTSPVHRIFLETAVHAIEDAGYGDRQLSGTKTGIYVGAIGDLEIGKYKDAVSFLDTGPTQKADMANMAGMACARLSQRYNFRGPSIVADTACSSSAVALDHACKALRAKTVDYAIVGSTRLTLFPYGDDPKFGFESSDGHTRTFDDSADGSGFGEGSIVLVLKSEQAARRDKDHIYALIKGSAVNHDGMSMNVTAPNPDAQKQVVVDAWNDADIRPNTISYIETHGTATPLGDPIEIRGLTEAFQTFTDDTQFCAVGSVKSNLGHMFECSGLAGILKCILAMQHQMIPPTLHCSYPNRKTDLIHSPLYINLSAKKWGPAPHPMRCGVSSFGMTGTNCHIVLEQAPKLPVSNVRQDNHESVFVLSAHSQYSLKRLVSAYCSFIKDNPEVPWGDFCYRVNTSHPQLTKRIAILADSVKDLSWKLARLDRENGLHQQADWFFTGDISGTMPKGDWDSLSSPGRQEATREAAVRFAEGYAVDFGAVSSQQEAWDCSLPAYPFEPKSLWEQEPDSAAGQADMTTVQNPEGSPLHSEKRQGEIEAAAPYSYERIFKKVQETCSRFISAELVSYGNFSEMGLDSLTIKGILGELQDEYPGKIELTDLFEFPSIQGIARKISDSQPKQKKTKPPVKENVYESGLNDLFDQLEAGMSPQQAKEMFNAMNEKGL